MSGLRYTDYLRGHTKAADIRSSVAAEGGFAIPSAIAEGIYMAQEVYSPMRQIARVTQASTPEHKILVSTGDAVAGFVSELDSRPLSDSPEVTERSAAFGELFAKPKALNYVLEDASFDVSAWLSASLVKAFNKAEGQAFLTGNGVDAPVGILNGLDLTQSSAADQVAGSYQVIHSGADGSFGSTASDAINFLMSMQDAVRFDYLAQSKWMMSRATYRSLSQLVNTSGDYLLNGQLSGPSVPSLLGHEVVFNDLMDSLPATTADVCPIMFGSFFDGYNIVDRVGMTVLRDEYSAHGATQFYARRRIGSAVLDADAIVIGAVSKA
jgi:HK97 family phage major capsid protein